MDLELMAQILNSDMLSHEKENLIVNVLAKDEEAIPNILKALAVERNTMINLTSEMNVELSRSLIILEGLSDKGVKGSLLDPKEAVVKVKGFYNKWTSYVRCCFKMEGID